MDQRVVIIMGPYRSGTSLVTQILSRLGVALGPVHQLYAPSQYNRSGYFQRPDVRHANNCLLVSSGGSIAKPPHPLDVIQHGDLSLLENVDLAWSRSLSLWGLKDPRFSITLNAWLEAKLFSVQNLLIIRVKRSIECAMRSGLCHYDIKHYCDGSVADTRKMIETYDRYAHWHCEHIGAPYLVVSYKQLLEEPLQTVREIAALLGEDNNVRIADAADVVGSQCWDWRYFRDWPTSWLKSMLAVRLFTF